MTDRSIKECFADLQIDQEEPKNEAVVSNTMKYHYIAQYVIDVRNDPYDPEILDFSYIAISGDMDADMYYSECVSNAMVDDLIPAMESGDPGGMVLLPGVYRAAFGVNVCGDKSWTDCGYEYDAWEEYDLISLYRFSDRETEVCWNSFCNVAEEDHNDPFKELVEPFE